MNLSKIKSDLKQVLQLVEDWHEKGVDAIERDLVLGILRELYSQVRFGASPEPETITPEVEKSAATLNENIECEPANLEAQPEPLPIGVAISLDDVFEEFAPVSLMPEVAEMPLEQENEEIPVVENVAEQPIDNFGEESTSEVVEEIVLEPIEEVPSQENEVADLEVTTTEDVVEENVEPTETAEKDIEEEVVEEKGESELIKETPKQAPFEPAMGQPSLFGDEELFVPRVSRRTKMMSLYDDEPRKEVLKPEPIPVSQPIEIAPASKFVPETQPVQPKELEVEVLEEEDDEFNEVDVETLPAESVLAPQPELETDAVQTEPYVEPQIEVTLATPTANAVPESEPVLGEVIKNNVQTLGDSIKPKDTAAEQIAKGSVDDISKAVGINDRFLLIRDLFGGSSDEYQRVMSELNGFTNLEDCMIYIVENYDWNPNSDGAKLIMELLERKYS